jgi:hypothetical protein
LGTTYVKCQNGKLVNISQNVTRLDEYTLVVRLTDGGPGDADGIANGISATRAACFPAEYAIITPILHTRNSTGAGKTCQYHGQERRPLE